MEVMELAKALGEALKKTDIMRRAEAAEIAFEGDEQLQADMNEYNVQQEAMAQTEDEAFRAVIRERLDELYHKIISNPKYGEYLSANEAVNRLMSEVNEEINFAVTGKHSCSGSCSSCGGCH